METDGAKPKAWFLNLSKRDSVKPKAWQENTAKTPDRYLLRALFNNIIITNKKRKKKVVLYIIRQNVG